MDETTSWFDITSITTVPATGSRTIQIKSTCKRHKRNHFIAIFTARANGGKTNPLESSKGSEHATQKSLRRSQALTYNSAVMVG